MSTGESISAWVKPKINRPPLSTDYFPRQRLLDELHARRRCPLLVIVGPAGYGKTTLLVSWLSNLDWPTAWVSLDSSDNSLFLFVQYIVAAIQKHFPDALDETTTLLHAVISPDEKLLARTLINELAEIDTPFVLALDDYHQIREPAIHDLVKDLLRYPANTFHLALTTRHDPPLPLSIMRAKGTLAEIRMDELRFNDDESAILLNRVTGTELSSSSIAVLAEQLDGWAAGLYLAGLTLRRKPALLTLKPALVSASSDAMSYLFDDVLIQQPPSVQEFLLRTSILNDLNQELCDAVAGATFSTYAGQSCLDYLLERNLFLSRTNDGNLHRYHHLFQSLLRSEFKRRHGDADFAGLYKRASDWHASRNQPEEALRYALQLRDPDTAVQVISAFRHELMNNDDWQRLEQWLSQLSRDVILSSADLLVAEAYIAYVRFRLVESAERLDRADALIAPMRPSPKKNALIGEISALRAWMMYQNTGDPLEIQRCALLGLRLTPQDRWQARNTAWLFASAALIFQGKIKEGLDFAQRSFSDPSAEHPGYKLRMFVLQCFLHGYLGNLSDQQRAAQAGIRICSGASHNDQDKWSINLNWSRFNLGSLHYHRNALAEAEAVLKPVVEQRYMSQVNCAVQSMLILALIEQSRGRPDEAGKMVELASQYALEMRSTALSRVIKLFEVQLALQQGRTGDAVQWLMGYTFPDKLPYLSFLYYPFSTFIKVHLAAGTPAHLDQAEDMLAALHRHVVHAHDKTRLIESLALMALLADARQDQRTALTHLEQALLLAQPEGFVRLFADLGARMSELLSRFHSRHVSPSYVRQITQAFAKAPASSVYQLQSGMVEPLTDREMDVLGLLMKRMSNKEIADALFISTGTVKHHTHVIFEKLDVHSRRDAVLKALDLNLLARP